MYITWSSVSKELIDGTYPPRFLISRRPFTTTRCTLDFNEINVFHTISIYLTRDRFQYTFRLLRETYLHFILNVGVFETYLLFLTTIFEKSFFPLTGYRWPVTGKEVWVSKIVFHLLTGIRLTLEKLFWLLRIDIRSQFSKILKGR